MNLVNRLAFFLILGATALSVESCNKDTTTPGNPTVTVTADKTTASEGDVVKVNIVAASDPARTLKNVKLEILSGSGTSQTVVATPVDSSVNTKSFGYTYTYYVKVYGGESTQYIRATVTDDAYASSQSTATLAVTGSANLSTYTMVMLPAPLSDKTSKSFFSTQNGNTYSYNDVVGTSASVSPLIDLGYYYTSNGVIAAPNDPDWNTKISYDMSKWGTRNATKFKTTSMTLADFTTASIANIDQAASGASAVNISNVSVGQVIAFTTAGNKNGLIYVEAMQPGFNSGDYIKIDVKVEK
jgi:hypothetical protein